MPVTRYLYKIYSRYDGFKPQRIPERMRENKYLDLAWAKYIDEVEQDDECWIYFYGDPSFHAGVFAKGVVRRVDAKAGKVVLRVREYATDKPIEDAETNARISKVVATKYRQVFLWPTEWDVVPKCERSFCRKRLCGNCSTWQGLPIIDADEVYAPQNVQANSIVPAYWVVPSRSYVYSEHKRLAPWTNRVSHMFLDFKTGEVAYAYPFALGMYEALRRRKATEFDAIIPIPLSPDKIEAEEFHRTRALAHELGKLLGIPVREYLTLTEPISKRRMKLAGYTDSQFRERYLRFLSVSKAVQNIQTALLVDDAITYGLTISAATTALKRENPQLEITVVAAAQMIIRRAVAAETGFVA